MLVKKQVNWPDDWPFERLRSPAQLSMLSPNHNKGVNACCSLMVHLHIAWPLNALYSPRRRWRQAIETISLLFAVQVGIDLIAVPIRAAQPWRQNGWPKPAIRTDIRANLNGRRCLPASLEITPDTRARQVACASSSRIFCPKQSAVRCCCSGNRKDACCSYQKNSFHKYLLAAVAPLSLV